MGIDVNLYVEAEVSPERLAAAEKFFKARSRLWDEWQGHVLVEEREDWLPNPRISLNTMSRYYGPGYERGDWPSIYAGIRLLAALFPEGTVFYGGDSSDDGIECTDEYLSTIWEHFLGPAGDAYHDRVETFNAAT